MTATPQPPPEATLIRERRLAMIPAMSRAQAARRAGFSAALLAKIEHGYDQVAAGIVIPYAGTPRRIAAVAAVLGITAAELDACGTPQAREAARILAASPPAPPPSPSGGSAAELRAMAAELEAMAAEMESRRDDDGPDEVRHASG